jgi:hypothetical protein
MLLLLLQHTKQGYHSNEKTKALNPTLNPKSISNCAQYVTMQKHFSHPSLATYFILFQPHTLT